MATDKIEKPFERKEMQQFLNIRNIQIDRFNLDIFFKFSWICPKCDTEYVKWVAEEMSHILRSGNNIIVLSCDKCQKQWNAKASIKLDIKFGK